MDWIRENKMISTLAGVMAAGVLVLGYLLFEAWGGYSTAMDEYSALGQQIAQIKGLALAPTEQNLKAKQALVDEYGANVSKLGGALLILQPASAPTKQAEFQTKLKDRVVQLKNLAQKQKVSLPPDFALGFSEYLGTLPTSDRVATELSGYLDGVEAIVKLAVTSNVKSIDLLERASLADEKQAAPRQPQASAGRPAVAPPGIRPAVTSVSLIEKRNVSIVMTLDQAALQLILSRLANPDDMKVRPEVDQSYFTSLRVLRVENQTKEGPIRRDSSGALSADAAATPPPAPPAPTENQPAADNANKALLPPPPAPADSVPVIGQELLKAQMEIDLVKFSDAIKVPAAP
jgi:hypothetical protein